MKLFNRSSTKAKRIALRQNQTGAEAILWQNLRGKRFHELKFFRQFGIGEYIADFYCTEKRVVIELDGSQHYTDEGISYDKARTEFLNSLNIRVVRFSNIDVINNSDGVLAELEVLLDLLKAQ